MKTLVVIMTFVFFNYLHANPFASKAKPQKIKKNEEQKIITTHNPLVNFFYLGKLQAEDGYFGVVIFNKKQYLVSKGEKIQTFKVMRLENEYILLLKEGKLSRINLY